MSGTGDGAGTQTYVWRPCNCCWYQPWWPYADPGLEARVAQLEKLVADNEARWVKATETYLSPVDQEAEAAAASARAEGYRQAVADVRAMIIDRGNPAGHWVVQGAMEYLLRELGRLEKKKGPKP